MTGPVLRRVPHPTRTLLGLPAILLGLALLAPTVHAQADVHLGHDAADHVESGTFVLKAGPDGTLACEHASEADLVALRSAPGAPPNFTVFTSTNTEREITGMRILLRATDQILEFPGALLAFRRAAARWERAISTPITTVIDVDFGPNRFNGNPFPANVLASATTAARTFIGVGPIQIVDALLEENGDDPQLAALYSAIPLPTPTTAGTDLQRAVVARPLAQVFGYLPAEADPDPAENPFGEFPTIGFNSAFSWDFFPADGVSPGQFDFEAVALHEMGHSLGFTSIIGNGGAPNNFFNVLDLFRVRPEAVTPGEPLDDGQGWETAERVVTPGPPSPDVVQVFFDGLQELPLSTATGNRQGGDGQQASHWRDDALGTPFIGIMDPNFANGTVGDYNDNDLRAFQTMGYRVTYDVPEATATFAVNGEPYDTAAFDSLAFIDIGDAPLDGTADLVFELTNTSTTVALDYSVEVEIKVGYPVGTLPTLTLSSEDGSIAPGSTGTVTLSGGSSEQSVFYGVFRVETNVENALVVDVPFRFSVDGGVAPELALSTEDAGYIGDFDDSSAETRSLFTVSNEGVIDLDYEATTTLVTDTAPFPFDIDIARTGGDVLFAEDFGNGDLGTFTAGGAFPGDWQVVDIGPALLDGRAEPNAAYFGQVTGGELQYRNSATGFLVGPALDLGKVAQDFVVLSFDTYLQSVTGTDIASVLVSYDDGANYQVIATSDGGVLQNTGSWETVRIELPLLAGSTESVRFAFQFISDSSTTDIGWLVDNVMLTTQGNPVFVTPAEGAIGEDGEQELSLTVEGSQFDPGYYRGAVTLVTNGLSFTEAGNPVGTVVDGAFVPLTARIVPFALTIGDPGLPTLTAETPPTVSVPSDNSEIVELDVMNTGGAQVTYLRLLEPAFSSFENAEGVAGTGLPGFGPVEFADPSGLAPVEPAASVVAGGDSLFSIVLPGAVIALTQSTNGNVVAAQATNNGRTYVLTEDLSEIRATLDGFLESPDRAVGLAFSDKTATYWYAVSSDKLVEASLGGSAVEPTGRVVDLDFTPAGIAYSPELDAFFVTERSSNLIHAVDESGTTLPGYPIESPGRGGLFPSLSMTNGVIEVLNDDLSYVQVDQFARLYEESEEVVVPGSLLGGFNRINGLLRSKVDPDGVLYYFTTPSSGEVLVVGVDPSDLPAYTQTLIEADSPLFGTDLVPDAPSTISLRIDPDGREPGMYADTLSFLTNSPVDRIVRVPFTIGVTPATSTEQGVTPTAFAMHQNYPNPFTAQTTLRFDLPTSARATLQVYNILGQRVATLLDDEVIEAGEHAVPLDAQRLASGTYVVRLMAGDFVGTSRVTVVK